MKNLSDFYRLFPSHPAMIASKASATPSRTVVAPAAAVVPANDEPVETVDAAPRYRARDYGTGYGRSSGYAQDRSYTERFGDRMLRVG